jgi:hypothetical protein
VTGEPDEEKDKQSEYRIFPEHMYKVNTEALVEILF